MSKLLRALKSMDTKEFSRFSKYIQSPYHCKHAETKRLFVFLESHHPVFNLSLFEDFSREHYSGQLKRSRFNLVKSYLLQQIYAFFTQEALHQRPLLEMELLVDNLRNRNLNSDATAKLKSEEHFLEKKELMDGDDFDRWLKLEQLYLDIGFSTAMRADKVRLNEFFNRLDQHYLTNSFKYLLPAWTLHQIIPLEFSEQRLEVCLHLISTLKPEMPLLTQIYQSLLSLLQTGQAQFLDELYRLLDDSRAKFSPIEGANVYGFLQNYFTHQYVKGEPKALGSLYELYLRLEDEDLIFGQGAFSEHLLRNVTIVACRLGKLEWINRFWEANERLITESIGFNSFRFGKAYIGFYIGNYSQVILLLQKIEFTDPFYRTGHQILLLRTYYESGEFESVSTLLNTFRRFINRTQSLSEKQKELSRNFISVLQQLLLAQDEEGATSRRLKRIEELLVQTNRVSDRTWLNEKLNELRLYKKP